MTQFDKEASQTRDYWVAKDATLRAARPDSSRRKERLFGMTIKSAEEGGKASSWLQTNCRFLATLGMTTK